MDKILVTGAGGFIGSHLCELLVQNGHQVKAFVRYNSKNSWGWLEKADLKNDIEIVTGDVRDYDSVRNALLGCSQVFHLAALIGIPYSYVSPLAYIKTNIEGTYNILEASRNLLIENIIVTSTSETYGTAQYVPIDENHPLVGQSPYSASKIAGDQLAISYFRSFSLPVKLVRPFNTFGPRQSARAVIPTIISQVLEQKSLKLGNLSPTRDLTFVKDTVAGFVEISKCNHLNGQVTNIGMNDEITVHDLIYKIADLMGQKVTLEVDNARIRPGKSEVERLMCDNSKILRETSWRPLYNLERGLTETIEWLKNNKHFYKTEIYNV